MPQVLIITGMHRSGTSLVASLLAAAGADLGDTLLPANAANPRGYFEDVEFIKFHEQLLSEREQHYLHIDSKFAFQATDEHRQRARQLADKHTNAAVWAWKDPRTALFLDFWLEQLPDARFLFVYRHPVEVLLSLLRRGEFDSGPYLTQGLQAWHTYNTRISSFYERHSSRCLLIHIDALKEQFEEFAQLARQKLELDVVLEADSFGRIFHAREMGNVDLPIEVSNILAKAIPGIGELYDKLNRTADLSADAGNLPAESSSRLKSLASFAAEVAEPISAADRHSLLLMLSSTLAPESTEAMLHSFTELKKKQLAATAMDDADSLRSIRGITRIMSVPAQMRMPERVALYSLVYGVRPNNCLEIGTCQGGSAAIICAAMDDVGYGQLSCVDPAPQIDGELWRQLGHRCRLFQGTSPAILPKVADEIGAPFEMVLVDGSQNYQDVRADIAGVLPLMADEGYLLFHDAHHRDVRRAIDEAIASLQGLTDCGFISVEPTFLHDTNGWHTWAGLRLVRFQRTAASAFDVTSRIATAADFQMKSSTVEIGAPLAAVANHAGGVDLVPPPNRVPVILAGVHCLSGVTTWAQRLRQTLDGHPRYDVRLLHVGIERPEGYDLFANTVDEARAIVRRLAPAILVPNYVWELYLASCDPGISCLGMCHAHSFEEYYTPLSWYEPGISQFIAVSPECAAQLIECLPVRAKDVTTLPYGVQVPQQLNRSYQTHPLRIMYAGRLTQPQKRVGDFVRLVEHLAQTQVPFEFDIVGDGDQFEPLQRAMQEWFSTAPVRFHGLRTHQEVEAMWPEHDVFVQVSEFEGTSLSMLEAMAHGAVPVVTAARSGVAGVVEHGKSGFVVPIGDMAAMAQAIVGLAGDSSLLAACGHAAHEAARAYGMEPHCDRFVQVLDRIVHTGRKIDQVKSEGGFGGHHPLFRQNEIIRSQQEELAKLRPEQSEPKTSRGYLRKLRDRILGRNNDVDEPSGPPLRKAA